MRVSEAMTDLNLFVEESIRLIGVIFIETFIPLKNKSFICFGKRK